MGGEGPLGKQAGVLRVALRRGMFIKDPVAFAEAVRTAGLRTSTSPREVGRVAPGLGPEGTEVSPAHGSQL